MDLALLWEADLEAAEISGSREDTTVFELRAVGLLPFALPSLASLVIENVMNVQNSIYAQL